MSRDQLEALRRQHEMLAEQVRRLVRTEQRLHRAQRAADAQLRRIEALNRFALDVAASGDATVVLGRAIDLLLGLYPYQQGIAFLGAPGAPLTAAAVRAAPGCAERSEAWLAARAAGATVPPVAMPGTPVLLGPPAPDVGPELAPLVARADEAFAPSAAGREPVGALLALPLRREQHGFVGLVLLRKLGHDLSPGERLASDEDRPFLALVGRHLEDAVASALLATRLRTVLGHLPGAVFVVRDERVVFANRTAATMLGYERPEELLGRDPAEFVHPDEHEALGENRRQVLAEGRPVRVLERRVRRRDGTHLSGEVTLLPLVFDGAPALLLVCEDLVERSRMRTQLAQAERLATVGALAAGVAHEVNNPLAYLLLNLEALARELPDAGGAAAGRLRDALDGARRIRDIVRDLRTFARVEEEPAAEIDVGRVLDQVLAMAAQELRYRARVVRELEPGVVARAVEGRLAQVFLNLVVNAAQAIDEGRVDEHEVRVRCRRDGDDVIVEVADTGRGIPAADLPRIFEPFFTTKPRGVGSGLGLSICRNIVQALGGRITAESEVGRGSRFTVRLPAAGAPPAAAAPARPPAADPAPPARRRVLVIDDEPRIAAAIAGLLDDRHDVVTADSGDAARAQLAARDFDAIVCDLMMPDVTGMDLHEWLARARPALAKRMIFVTGGAFTPRARAFLERVPNPRLDKPFDVDDLARAIADVADPSRTRGR